MFTPVNFIKLGAALALAYLFLDIPLIGDIGKPLDEGIYGKILSFVLLVGIWWFVIGQILSFLIFAFGGGVGRYHTTKLYRRLQWLTFLLLISIPIFIGSFLLLNTTPLSVESDEYKAAYQTIIDQRLATAQRVQQQQIARARQEREQNLAAAKAEREAKLNAAEEERQEQITLAQSLRRGEIAKAEAERRNKLEKAESDRSEKIEKAETERRDKIEKLEAERRDKITAAKSKRTQEIANAKREHKEKFDAIDRDQKGLKEARSRREATIDRAVSHRNANLQAAREKRIATYNTALQERENRVDDEWEVHRLQLERNVDPKKNQLRSKQRNFDRQKNGLGRANNNKRSLPALSQLSINIARTRNITVNITYVNAVMDILTDYEKYKNARAVTCKSPSDDNTRLFCTILSEIQSLPSKRSSRYIGRSNGLYELSNIQRSIDRVQKAEADLFALQREIASVEAQYESIKSQINRKYRKPQLADYPPVDMSRFPEVDQSEFPEIDTRKYPLAGEPLPPRFDVSKFPPVDMALFPPIDLKRFPPVDMSEYPPIDMSKYPPVDMSKYPPVDMSKYPPVDLSRFPQINEANYPKINASDYPLAIDNSPLTLARSSYEERLESTFNAHFWWYVPAVLILSIIVLLNSKPAISRIFSRIRRFFDEGRFGFGGSARFASMLEEWGNPYKSGTLYMGRSLFNPFDNVGIGGEAHMLTIAGSRGGKGTSAIIPNLLLWEGSAVVIDPKGTNAHVTANARREMGQDVHIIDPFGIVTKESARFDPLEHIEMDDPLIRERIASIADALVIPDDNSKETHWDDGARTIISGLIAQVLAQKTDTKRLFEIRDLINQQPEEQDSLWADMAIDEEDSGYARDAAIRYMRGSNTNEILGIMSNADKHTEWLSSPVMRSITSNPTFSIKDIKKKPTTIYLVIPPRQLERQNRLLRLFINLVIDAMEDGGRSKIPVLMIMDEFLALGKMPEISTAFATMASYNLTLWPFVQEMEKLKSMYGGSFNSFIANSRALQVFATSDQKTKEYISERFGSRPLSGINDIAKSNDTIPLRAPNDVEIDLAASERRQYVIEAGKPAMLLEKVPYYDDKPVNWLGIKGRFSGRYDVDPDFAV